MLKLIETIRGNKHIVKIYFEMAGEMPKYTVIPCTRPELAGYEYPVNTKIKAFTSREAANHYAKQL